MKLDRKDVEAVAKSRTNRAEGNKLMYYTIFFAVAVLIGGWISGSPTMGNKVVGFAVAIVGVVVFAWYLRKVQKRIEVAKHLLVGEWEAENKRNEAK